MNQEHDYLKTSIWYREKITDPYQTIAEFFSNDDIANCRKINKGALLAACSNKIYKKTSPGELLFHFKMLESVINAAFLINKEKKESPLNILPGDIFNKNLYCGYYTYLNEWDYFPRALSLKEYSNPYLVFKSFFKHKALQEWKSNLQEILEYALIDCSLFESDIDVEILSIYFHLSKLIEAVHLIDVRETNHVKGVIKNRVKRI